MDCRNIVGCRSHFLSARVLKRIGVDVLLGDELQQFVMAGALHFLLAPIMSVITPYSMEYGVQGRFSSHQLTELVRSTRDFLRMELKPRGGGRRDGRDPIRTYLPLAYLPCLPSCCNDATSSTCFSSRSFPFSPQFPMLFRVLFFPYLQTITSLRCEVASLPVPFYPLVRL